MDETKSTVMLTRGKLAKKVGCNSETIRYYENVGMLLQPDRAENGYRIYSDIHLKQLRFIQRAKELGFNNESVKSLLRVTKDLPNYTRAEVKGLTQGHIDEIESKIKDLSLLRKTLKDLSAHCDGAFESAEDCPIIKSLSKKS